MTVAAFRRAFRDNLYYLQGKDEKMSTMHDHYMALSYTVRDRLVHRWIKSANSVLRKNVKVVFYLSAEFLMGKQLGNNLVNSDSIEISQAAMESLGIDLEELLHHEAEPGLGNGGLGRLAACYLDSLATIEIPAIGYGIRYEYGIFEQGIENGWQVEHPDKWLQFGNPWEIARPEYMVKVNFGGHTDLFTDERGYLRTRWVPAFSVFGTPYDTMVPGFDTNTVNTLRLWSAKASHDFDFQLFNDGDYQRAVSDKVMTETLTKVLYPNDNTPQGRELRLKQQYFFVSCSLQDIIRIQSWTADDLEHLHNKAAIQLNDTHPSIGVAELMRLLVDRYGLGWEKAWEVTTKSFGYTNHTLLAEALERWPVELFERLLPRHLEIIYEINRRFLAEVEQRFPGDEDRIQRMSLIEEGPVRRVRMAHLACVGSHHVNGVAELHSELLKKSVLKDFYEMWPEKFTNVTNGVTPRRFMQFANPKMSELITSRIGSDWMRNLEELSRLQELRWDHGFCRAWADIKHHNKQRLADVVRSREGVNLNPDSLFDVQVKRLHEYKRQLLNVLFIISLYRHLKDYPNLDIVPRTFIFGAKAAPGYFMAKLIIKLINSVADVVNSDPVSRERMRVIFLSNFCVSLGEAVYPAADLSEQISMAGKEASGTGNMKFALNGALTIGTLDGANIEIRDRVGHENFFLFGLTAEEAAAKKASGYHPREYYESNLELRAVVDAIAEGQFSEGDRNLFRPIVDMLINYDTYMHMADFASYVECQGRVDQAFRDRENWTRMSILNTARCGFFSSDRSMRDYCEKIWKTRPIRVEMA
jgi:starch phosphorylase